MTGNLAATGGGIHSESWDPLMIDGTVVLKGSSSVTGNTATIGGGIRLGIVKACDADGADEWTGAISPNDPDDPPMVTWLTCLS